MTFTLEQIHAVEAKAFYSDDGVGRFGAWLGSGGIDEEGGCRAGAIFHVWNLKRQWRKHNRERDTGRLLALFLSLWPCLRIENCGK